MKNAADSHSSRRRFSDSLSRGSFSSDFSAIRVSLLIEFYDIKGMRGEQYARNCGLQIL